MFFERRRWALRVIERMGLQAREPAAAELVDMMINGAKMYKDMMRGTAGVKITERELVLMAVASMSDNRSAFERLRRVRLDAERLLAALRVAGRLLAVENGFHTLVTRFYDRLPEVNAEVLLNKPTPDKALANFRRQIVEENLAAARNMPSDTRGLMVRDLSGTYSLIDDSKTFERRTRTLQGIMSFALNR